MSEKLSDRMEAAYGRYKFPNMWIDDVRALEAERDALRAAGAETAQHLANALQREEALRAEVGRLKGDQRVAEGYAAVAARREALEWALAQTLTEDGGTKRGDWIRADIRRGLDEMGVSDDK